MLCIHAAVCVQHGVQNITLYLIEMLNFSFHTFLSSLTS